MYNFYKSYQPNYSLKQLFCLISVTSLDFAAKIAANKFVTTQNDFPLVEVNSFRLSYKLFGWDKNIVFSQRRYNESRVFISPIILPLTIICFGTKFLQSIQFNCLFNHEKFFFSLFRIKKISYENMLIMFSFHFIFS